ncbi:hypothetical protein COU56_01455 [Candidatus Pacearchaeota archaeon CG10_big_fil_rev_8_21_14_0_10_31_9]|nr:MAG: hypothetical protein COU56_01455 [Candidatus Pacearchaeota archaeon CG10_big_fil_rev_8_21_14_0_10_31_9]
MKKIEAVYRDILYSAMEEKKYVLTQLELSKKLDLSLSIVNSAVKKLKLIGAVKLNQRSFQIIDLRKILYYWASIRNLKKDVILSLRVEAPVREIERILPNIIFTAYSAYKYKFDDVPADYSEIYAYADEEELKIIKERLSKFKLGSDKNNIPNLFFLKKDVLIDLYKEIPICQIFVDLWNLNQWYAKDFINALEKRIDMDGEG